MRRIKAFTLVELLVVIGIIAVLISVLLPALSAARRQAASVKCASQLREIGNAFKLYELEYKGYWPVARINGYGPRYPLGPYTAYNIDGFNYQDATQGYWFNFLAKYVTKSKVGNAASSATDGFLARRSIFYSCPEWEGYRAGGTMVGGLNVVQPGFGMNPYPTYTDQYPTGATLYPPTTERAIVGPFTSELGKFYKAKAWTRPSERLLVSDSRFWLAQSGRPPATGPYPPAVVPQPILENSGAGVGGNSQTLIDMYRHGKTPGRDRTNGNNYDPRGGKIAYNILYCDGHVATATEGKEAYRSIRMKFPG